MHNVMCAKVRIIFCFDNLSILALCRKLLIFRVGIGFALNVVEWITNMPLRRSQCLTLSKQLRQQWFRSQ